MRSSDVETAFLDDQRALSWISDSELMLEMLQLMDTSLSVDLPELRQGLSVHAWQAVTQGLHRLKGAVPMFCDAETALQLNAVEQLTKQLALEDCAAIRMALEPQAKSGLTQLLDRLDRFHTAVKSWLVLNA